MLPCEENSGQQNPSSSAVSFRRYGFLFAGFIFLMFATANDAICWVMVWNYKKEDKNVIRSDGNRRIELLGSHTRRA
jgi:hypothetical protein